MNQMLKKLRIEGLLLEAIPSLGLSLLIAEMYYKLGSFSLECIAFLATWIFTGYFFNQARKQIILLTKKK